MRQCRSFPGLGCRYAGSPGGVWAFLERGVIENVYRLQVMNGLEQPQRYRASVQGVAGLQMATEAELAVEATGIAFLAVRLTLPPEAAQAYRGQTLPIVFTVQTQVDGRAVHTDEKSTFYVPR
jgi:polyferredoxin